MRQLDRRWLYSGLLIGVALVLTSCGASSGAGAAQVPPTPTEPQPPDWKTPTPVPPENQSFFIALGDAGAGVSAIPPHQTVPGSAGPPLSAAEVQQYVATHAMQGSKVSIAADPSPVIMDVALLTLSDMYQQYFAEALRQYGWLAPQPPTTPVYIATLQGRFRFSGGPPPGDLGIYRIGVWVFDARSGDALLEGGVGRSDQPLETAP